MAKTIIYLTMVRLINNEHNRPKLSTESILASADYLRVKSCKYGWLCDDNFVMPYFIDEKLSYFRRLVITLAPMIIKGRESVADVLGEDWHHSLNYLVNPRLSWQSCRDNAYGQVGDNFYVLDNNTLLDIRQEEITVFNY